MLGQRPELGRSDPHTTQPRVGPHVRSSQEFAELLPGPLFDRDGQPYQRLPTKAVVQPVADHARSPMYTRSQYWPWRDGMPPNPEQVLLTAAGAYERARRPLASVL